MQEKGEIQIVFDIHIRIEGIPRAAVCDGG